MVNQRNEKLEEFNAMCTQAQNWAKSVGVKESDISMAIKEVRAENYHRSRILPPTQLAATVEATSSRSKAERGIWAEMW